MTIPLNDSAVLLAPFDARNFLRFNGDSLSEVLNVIAGERGLELFCEADSLLEGLSPDPVRVGKVLSEMRDLLVEADTPEVRYAESLRWHGARLTDLAAKLPR